MFRPLSLCCTGFYIFPSFLSNDNLSLRRPMATRKRKKNHSGRSTLWLWNVWLCGLDIVAGILHPPVRCPYLLFFFIPLPSSSFFSFPHEPVRLIHRPSSSSSFLSSPIYSTYQKDSFKPRWILSRHPKCPQSGYRPYRTIVATGPEFQTRASALLKWDWRRLVASAKRFNPIISTVSQQ